jgi:hypothetical protein
MMTYNEQIQRLADRYMREIGRTEVTAREMALWAIRNNYWKPQSSVLIRQCADEFSRAMA